jgi:hypothetical protein
MAEKARTLYKKADAAALAVLIFESILLGPAASGTATKDDDPLTDAAALYKVDIKRLRGALLKDARKTDTRKGHNTKNKE